jgi:hypothetical protein
MKVIVEMDDATEDSNVCIDNVIMSRYSYGNFEFPVPIQTNISTEYSLTAEVPTDETMVPQSFFKNLPPPIQVGLLICNEEVPSIMADFKIELTYGSAFQPAARFV